VGIPLVQEKKKKKNWEEGRGDIVYSEKISEL